MSLKITKKHIFIIILLPFLLLGFIFLSNDNQKVMDSILGAQTEYIDFTLPDSMETNVNLSDELESKPVVLAFYASWCPTCQYNAPKLSQMAHNYEKYVTVLGIDSKESGKSVDKFIKQYSITHPVLIDIEGKVAQEYGVGYNNFYIMINKDGSIYKKTSGEIKEDELVRFIDNNS